MQNIFERAFASIMVYWMFVLSLRLMTDDNSTGVDGDSLEILLKIFFNVGRKVYIISDIVSSSMNYEIIWLFLDYVIQFA